MTKVNSGRTEATLLVSADGSVPIPTYKALPTGATAVSMFVSENDNILNSGGLNIYTVTADKKFVLMGVQAAVYGGNAFKLRDGTTDVLVNTTRDNADTTVYYNGMFEFTDKVNIIRQDISTSLSLDVFIWGYEIAI